MYRAAVYLICYGLIVIRITNSLLRLHLRPKGLFEPHHRREIEHLLHEVFPEGVDSPPVVREAPCEEEEMVALRKVEAEKAEEADDEVELTGYPEI